MGDDFLTRRHEQLLGHADVNVTIALRALPDGGTSWQIDVEVRDGFDPQEDEDLYVASHLQCISEWLIEHGDPEEQGER